MDDNKDFLNQLQGKVTELKARRNEMTQSSLDERMKLNQIDEQLAKIQQEKRDAQMKVNEKENQIRKYDELIK